MNIFHSLQDNNFLEGFLNLPAFLISYAEIHYHFKFLVPKYYKKEPEIITDIPIRVIRNKDRTIPFLIIVKDAHLYNILIHSVKVTLEFKAGSRNLELNINREIKEKYYSRIFDLDVRDIEPDQVLKISAKLEVKINDKIKIVVNDNYSDINTEFYTTFYARDSLPLPVDWFAGETHYHSIHTADQVEFGADIPATAKMAQALGLNWVFITDHSYDLDDSLDSYTENDKKLPIWLQMKENVKKSDSETLRMIAGEEVSIANAKGKNVHMVAVDYKNFIEGRGDSAEKWFRNKPQRHLTEISELHQEDNLFFAAHPIDKVPFLQKLTLRRGNWTEQDYQESGINILQIINRSDQISLNSALNYWRKLLLKGKRFLIIAGNDAHGNFNVMRQIKIPFRKLFASRDQVFGNFFTAFKYKNNSPAAGIKNGEIIVSNGPFLCFHLQTEKKNFSIGSIFSGKNARLTYEIGTTAEFGETRKLTLIIGDCSKGTETEIINPKNNFIIELPENGYLRMILNTENDGIVITNPIWIEQISVVTQT
ncbi:MAG: CehA/McbA family metallohydrolase [Candidatus Cloacimonetes bacterium]|nr:CehA/McbA family metallohydrolase [Candidatus Cloacimonadota bacterium]